MGRILKYAITSIGNPEAVVAATVCQAVTVMEDQSVEGWPTVSLVIYKLPLNLAEGMVIQPGLRYTFVPSGQKLFFNPGDLVGYVATQSGSSECVQDET